MIRARQRHKRHIVGLLGGLLAMALLLSSGTPAQAAFSDTRGHWAERVIDRVAAKGMLKGYETGRFEPDQPVSRVEVVATLVRALGGEAAARARTSLPEAFKDPRPLPGWARGYVGEAVERGIVVGSDLQDFHGDLPAIRLQVAIWVARALG
ncbi:MAG: S-layer homology domain-containing protein, partial [Clostridia bacterium]|nr:S-layer homology domain-containing protein [Clostridia bacterium]